MIWTFHAPLTRRAVSDRICEIRANGGRPRALLVSRIDYDRLPLTEFISIGEPDLGSVIIGDELPPGYWQIACE